jgi:ribonuclease E
MTPAKDNDNIFDCVNCGEEFELDPDEIEEGASTEFCSPECEEQWSEENDDEDIDTDTDEEEEDTDEDVDEDIDTDDMDDEDIDVEDTEPPAAT